MLTLAIGFHALFEGIALGLMDEAESLWQLSIGIFIHKTAAAVSLGAAFTNSGFSKCVTAILITIFALMTPIGILIGLALENQGSAIMNVIFIGLSAGTFLYVACSEIITHEFSKSKNMGAKLVMVVLGGLVIIVLWLLHGEHAHDHGHGLEA